MMGNKKKMIASISYLVVVAIVASISLMTFLDKSTAWFSYVRNVDAHGMELVINDGGDVGIGSINIYKVDENNNSASLYTDPDAEDLIELLTLNQYDYVFEEKRGHIPIIVKTTLVNFHGDIDKASEVTVTINLNDSVTGYTEVKDEKTYLIPNISNFISIACATDSRFSEAAYINEGVVNAINYYPHARDLFLDNKEEFVPQTFVNYNLTDDPENVGKKLVNIGEEKSNSLTFTVTRPAGQETLDVYLLLTYDENLIAKYVADQNFKVGDGGELEDYFAWGAIITFDKDISNIVFSEVSSGNE